MYAVAQHAPVQGSRARLAEQDHPAQLRGRDDREGRGRLRVEARQQRLDHRQVVDAVGAVGGDQRRGVRLDDHIGYVAGAKAGVDGHQDRADLGGGEEQEDVLGPVAEPQADVVAGLHAAGDQRLGGPIDLLAQGGERPSPFLAGERLAVAPAVRRSVDQVVEPELLEPHLSARRGCRNGD